MRYFLRRAGPAPARSSSRRMTQIGTKGTANIGQSFGNKPNHSVVPADGLVTQKNARIMNSTMKRNPTTRSGHAMRMKVIL